MIYCQISILVFLNLLNQFLAILWAFIIFFSLQLFFWISSEYTFLYFFHFYVGTQKWLTTDAPSLQFLRSKDFAY